jgi:hypothetical protein
MGHTPLRDDIPISLPQGYKAEALELRNKLLLFRYRRRDAAATAEALVDRTIEPRLNQIFMPLLGLVDDPRMRGELQELARRYNRELVVDRGMDAEAHLLEIIRDMLASDDRAALSVKEITSWFVERHGAEYDRKITPKWVGGLIRRRLGLKTHKTNGVFAIPREEEPRLPRLYVRYGVEPQRPTGRDGPF